jgi:hypothetical protein
MPGLKTADFTIRSMRCRRILSPPCKEVGQSLINVRISSQSSTVLAGRLKVIESKSIVLVIENITTIMNTMNQIVISLNGTRMEFRNILVLPIKNTCKVCSDRYALLLFPTSMLVRTLSCSQRFAVTPDALHT